MMAVNSLGRVVFGILVLVAAASAYADGSGFYGDFDLGVATYSYATEVKFPAVTLSAVDPRIKDTSWGVNVGYRFIPYFGAEAGYVSLGKGSVPAADASGAGNAHGSVGFTSKGPTLGLVGAVQAGNLEAFLKLGYLFAHADLSVAATDGSTKLNTRMTASTPAPVAGLGFRYAFNESWHVKFEFDHYDRVGDAETTGAANINVAALGIGCRF
jgi:OmpA-OmpF porin, OOP family